MYWNYHQMLHWRYYQVNNHFVTSFVSRFCCIVASRLCLKWSRQHWSYERVVTLGLGNFSVFTYFLVTWLANNYRTFLWFWKNKVIFKKKKYFHIEHILLVVVVATVVVVVISSVVTVGQSISSSGQSWTPSHHEVEFIHMLLLGQRMVFSGQGWHIQAHVVVTTLFIP